MYKILKRLRLPTWDVCFFRMGLVRSLRISIYLRNEQCLENRGLVQMLLRFDFKRFLCRINFHSIGACSELIMKEEA